MIHPGELCIHNLVGLNDSFVPLVSGDDLSEVGFFPSLSYFLIHLPTNDYSETGFGKKDERK